MVRSGEQPEGYPAPRRGLFKSNYEDDSMNSEIMVVLTNIQHNVDWLVEAVKHLKDEISQSTGDGEGRQRKRHTTPEQASVVKKLLAMGVQQQHIAKYTGVCAGSVSRIYNGRMYSEVTPAMVLPQDVLDAMFNTED